MRALIALAAAVAASAPLCGLADTNAPAVQHRAPLQLSVCPPVQLFPRDTEIDGLRLDLPLGVNGVVRGLDVGIAGIVTQQMTGVQAQLVFSEAEDARGVQLTPGPLVCLNRAEQMRGVQVSGLILPFWVSIGVNNAENLQGLQLATVANTIGDADESGPSRGAQLSFYYNRSGGDAILLQEVFIGVNQCRGSFCGMQGPAFAGCNLIEGDGEGLQLMILGANVARKSFAGVQIGPYNTASEARGLQLGAVNYCHHLRGVQLGLVNICRDQSLPCLPILNVRF